MRTFAKGAVVLLVPVLFGATARSADPEGSTVKLLLLRQKSVQMELKLTPDTAKKIMTFTHAQHEAARKALELEKGARKEAFDKLRKENSKFLADTLNADQSKRLNQITMQFTALTHLTRPKVARELELSEDQVKKLKELHAEARKAVRELLASRERAGKGEKLTKLREEARKKILAVLTDEQKRKVRELVGAPFEGKIEFEEAE